MALLALFFILLAIKKISIVNTVLLQNSAPFFVPFILWFWLKKPVEWKIWPAVVVGFIGIALILQPTKWIFDLGAGYALLSGICLAFSLILMRMTSRVEKFYSFIFYFFTIGAVVTAPFAILDWKIDGGLTLLGLLVMGLCAGLGQILFFYGLKLGKAKHLAPFTYSAVVFTGIYEWLIWGALPHPIAYAGIVLIIAAGIWIVYISRPSKIKPH